MAFVDRADIQVKGGDGGDGCVSFRREKYIPHGGPNGGDGGDGGSVIIRADANADSLADLSFQRHWNAESGRPGMGKGMTGRSGEDLIIRVPPGTIIRDREYGFIIKDMVSDGSELVIAKGGRGGRGNAAFTSSTNRVPTEWEPGQPGEMRRIVLELKVIADVGLVGKPNAGKSTLLSRITRARPEIANYPFTTKFPNLGICTLGGERTCVVADIPGLIEGAHEGVGLGHEFLRHVERTRLLVHLVECLPMDETDPLANYRAIREELRLYSPKLAAKPEIVVISKGELMDTAEMKSAFETELKQPVHVMSAVTGKGLPDLLRLIAGRLDEIKATESAATMDSEKPIPPHLRPELADLGKRPDGDDD
jgi:GTP-binding protein